MEQTRPQLFGNICSRFYADSGFGHTCSFYMQRVWMQWHGLPIHVAIYVQQETTIRPWFGIYKLCKWSPWMSRFWRMVRKGRSIIYNGVHYNQIGYQLHTKTRYKFVSKLHVRLDLQKMATSNSYFHSFITIYWQIIARRELRSSNICKHYACIIRSLSLPSSTHSFVFFSL